MALFNTPNLLHLIFQKETFPEGESGFTGLAAGLESGGKAKQEKTAAKAGGSAPAPAPAIPLPQVAATPALSAVPEQSSTALAPQNNIVGFGSADDVFQSPISQLSDLDRARFTINQALHAIGPTIPIW